MAKDGYRDKTIRQEKWVWMGGEKLGMDLRDVTRFQGLMDAGCMDGKRSESVRGL
jgi:hypothetical protein